ncbi:MAG: DUF2927 domain-containing protein [Marinibacterium sp.]|nr:DUF2927 domain-containing protein [Marinibacterium sp.]
MMRAWAAITAASLAACTVPPVSAPAPVAPAAPAAAPPAAPAGPSEQSIALRRYYSALQADLLTRGLLRTDGGGPDTRFDADDLVVNFSNIVFYDEYRADAGLSRAAPTPSGGLRRWDGPVRMAVRFGASVPQDRRDSDEAEIASYAARLSRVSGLPITLGSRGANFHVFISGYDDRAELEQSIRALAPAIAPETLAALVSPPRSVQCLVAAFQRADAPFSYGLAIAVIRDEHPDLMRRSCIHEELAQGLGLANDSPTARPSIFNDDDEFALLTTHDEFLLQMLYDPRLRTGQSLDSAQPVIREIADGLLPTDL